MKFLLIPENNSLSHITKCLAVRELLLAKGHEVQIAIAQKHGHFLDDLGIPYHILADIQETDCGGFPSFKWFSNVDTIVSCIQAEVALINQIKPDRILGIFRFTLFASAQIVGLPYDSLICGCMIPDCHEVLGFYNHEAGAALQKQFLANFFRFAGMKTSLALRKFGLDPIDDIRVALKGERTFLWDFPEFMPLASRTGLIHIGPIAYAHWPYTPVNLDRIFASSYPLAVISFGTCVTDNRTVLRIIKLLLDLGYQIIVAAGGQPQMYQIATATPRVTVLNFAPLNQIFPHTALLVTHGGQMTVFEALQSQVPVCVMPLQPEQAHNGVCLERIGCGQRLIPSTHFTGMPEDYIQAFDQLPDAAIKTKIDRLVADSQTKANLSKIRAVIAGYQGARTLVDRLEVKP